MTCCSARSHDWNRASSDVRRKPLASSRLSMSAAR